jgi:hypothetical protein
MAVREAKNSLLRGVWGSNQTRCTVGKVVPARIKIDIEGERWQRAMVWPSPSLDGQTGDFIYLDWIFGPRVGDGASTSVGRWYSCGSPASRPGVSLEEDHWVTGGSMGVRMVWRSWPASK